MFDKNKFTMSGMRVAHRLMRLLFVATLGVATVLPLNAAANGRIGVPGLRGGVVTTSEPIAAQVGSEILRDGGNAIDAAAAVAFALNVVEPQSSGIGGGGFMMIHLSGWKPRTFVVDSRERAPGAASPDMFLNTAGEPFPFGVRSTSGIGVGVPGMVAGIETALERWGTMTLGEVLAPAISLAEKGFRVSSRLESSIASGIAGGRLANEIDHPAYDEARSIFAPGGTGLVQGDLLVQPALAQTLKLIAEHGSDAFYKGAVAADIISTQQVTRTADDLEDEALLAGRMVLDDLASYSASIRHPVVGHYRGFRIASMPPPSSGGQTVIQVLKLLERFPIGDADRGFGFGSKRTLNVMIEAGRLAFADRAVWMGDADFVTLPVQGLIARDYIATRTGLIDPDVRRDSVQAGDPRPFDLAMANTAKPIRLAAVDLPDEEGLNTTHFSIVDKRGNVVSYTNTIESAWGTGLMVPGRGFLLNNELTDFNSRPTADPDPDNFNPGANDAAPFKRPRSSMAPTMVFRGRRPVAAFGSPGGSTIIWSVINTTMNLIDHRRVAQEVVDLPRIATLSGTGFTFREFGFEDSIIDDLRDMGHTIVNSTSIGSVQLVVIDPYGRRQYGAADRRRIGGVRSLPRARRY